MSDKLGEYRAIEKLKRIAHNSSMNDRVIADFYTLQSQLAASEAMNEKMAEALGKIDATRSMAYTDKIKQSLNCDIARDALTAYEQQKGKDHG